MNGGPGLHPCIAPLEAHEIPDHRGGNKPDESLVQMTWRAGSITKNLSKSAVLS